MFQLIDFLFVNWRREAHKAGLKSGRGSGTSRVPSRRHGAPGHSRSRESWAQTRELLPFLPAQHCRKSKFSSGVTCPFCYELQCKRKKTHHPPHRRARGHNLQTLLAWKSVAFVKKQDSPSQTFWEEKTNENFCTCARGAQSIVSFARLGSTFWTIGSTSFLGHSSSGQVCGGPQSASWSTLLCKDRNTVRTGGTALLEVQGSSRVEDACWTP